LSGCATGKLVAYIKQTTAPRPTALYNAMETSAPDGSKMVCDQLAKNSDGGSYLPDKGCIACYSGVVSIKRINRSGRDSMPSISSSPVGLTEDAMKAKCRLVEGTRAAEPTAKFELVVFRNHETKWFAYPAVPFTFLFDVVTYPIQWMLYHNGLIGKTWN
jgi:hypothetical protein